MNEPLNDDPEQIGEKVRLITHMENRLDEFSEDLQFLLASENKREQRREWWREQLPKFFYGSIMLAVAVLNFLKGC